MKNKGLFLALSLFVLLASWLRFTGIWQGNFTFTFDQGRDILDIQKIANGKFTLIGPFTAVGGIFLGPLYYYLLLIPFVLSGGYPQALVIFMGLWGIISIIYGYYLTRKMINKTAAFFFVAFSVISSPLIAFSRYFHNPNPLSFLLIVFVFFLYKAVVEEKKLFLPLTLFILGVMFQFQVAFSFFLLLSVFMVIIFFRKFSFFKSRYFLLSLLLLAFTFLPQIVFEFRHDFLMSKSILALTRGQKKDLYAISKPILESLKEKENIPWDDFTTAVAVDYRTIAVFWLLITGYGYLLIYKRNLKREKKLLELMAVIILVFFIGFILYPGPIYGWYRAGFPSLYILLVSVGTGVVWKMGRHKTKIVIIIVFTIMYFLQINHLKNIWKVEKLDKQLGLLRNELKVLDYIYKDAQQKNFGVLVYTPPVYDYQWQYLLNWYGDKKYGYVPPKEKLNTFYLIIEPDREQPWRSKGWLETVIKEGRTISKKEFPDGIMVEKRILE